MKFSDYKIHNINLYVHQIETIQFYLHHKRCFIFDDIGTGKTMTMLAATDFLKINKKIDKVLIISPLSVMFSTWSRHIVEFFPHREFTVLHGTKQKRLALLDKEKTYYIINTDGIKIIEKELIDKKFDVLIIDESTTYSIHSSFRTKSAWRISKKIKSVVAMTGNPIPNNTIQSYAQSKLINLETAPKYFTRFRDKLKVKFDMFTYIDRPEATQLAYDVLTPSIRHTIEECIDLPDITYQYIDVRMTPQQKKLYKTMEKEYVAEIKSGLVTAANSAVKALKLMQISSGILIDGNSTPEIIDNYYRLNEIDNIYYQLTRKKLIIFAAFTASVNQLVDHFKGKAKKIDGSVSAKNRAIIIKEFQDEDLEVLICQPAAISHGVNLFVANTIIWLGPCYSNEHLIQCNGRIRRVGQTRKQLVIYLQSTRMEKLVYKALKRKQSVSKALLELI